MAAWSLAAASSATSRNPDSSGDLDHHLGVHRVDDHSVATGGRVGAHDDVAGQQQADLPVGVHRAVGQRRVAGTEDEVVLHVLAELGLQRGLHVDLGQDAETLIRKRFAGAFDCVLERGVQCR